MSNDRRSPGRPKTNSNGVPTRDRIIDAAESAFAARGFEGARLEDIAEQAGIRRPSLLYHFDSKESLYEAVLDEIFAVLREDLTEAFQPTGDLATDADALLHAYRSFMAKRPAFPSLVLRAFVERTGPGRSVFQDHLLPALTMVEGWLGAHAPDATVRRALLLVTADSLLRAAAGEAGDAIWPSDPASGTLLAKLVLAG